MTESLTSDGYPRKPRNLPGGAWYYEEPKGICIVIGLKQTNISWSKIEAAIRHHHAAKRRKK